MDETKLVSMLMAPPKPDLEGFKAEVMESDELQYAFNIPPKSSLEFWGTAGNVIAAKAMITRKYHPDSYGASRAIYDAYNRWRGSDIPGIKGTREEMREAVDEAVMKTVKKFFTKEHTVIKRGTSDAALKQGFYINMCLGYHGSPHNSKAMYSDWVGTYSKYDGITNEQVKKYRELLPDADMTGNSMEFLMRLMCDDRKAMLLAKYGFQNMVISERRRIVLIPIVQCALALVRNRLRPHSLKGPAVVMKTKKKHYVNGVQMDARSTRWQSDPEVFEKFIDTEKGELRPGMIKEIIQIRNTEQRRVLLELTEPEELLEQCDAQLIDGPTELGNELFRVDVGLTSSWRKGHPWEEDPEKGMTRRNLACMLRYKCPSTDRVYVKFVPEEYVSADEAQAWSHHFTLEEYKKLKVQS